MSEGYLLNELKKCDLPVSYTHLDVYKRQTLTFAASPAVVPTVHPRKKACLLYTSSSVFKKYVGVSPAEYKKDNLK